MMIHNTSRGTAVAATLALACFTPALAQHSPAPVRLDAEKMAGLNLTAIGPERYQDILVAGELILTEPNGSAHEFLPGDTLVLPKGYAGTWEMQGNYRELAVVMQKEEGQ